jgi:hypothetical protein
VVEVRKQVRALEVARAVEAPIAAELLQERACAIGAERRNTALARDAFLIGERHRRPPTVQ